MTIKLVLDTNVFVSGFLWEGNEAEAIRKIERKEAIFNFYEKYKGKIEPQILASLVHFMFVSIHPFIDGNGRVARLIHSFILMKAGLPLFAFDPNHRNTYFSLLDKGMAESVEEFVQFCIDKHKVLIERL